MYVTVAREVELPLVRYRHHGGSQSERTTRREVLATTCHIRIGPLHN